MTEPKNPNGPKQPEPLHDPPAPPLQDPPDKPMHDPAGDPTHEPEQPFGDPTPTPGQESPPGTTGSQHSIPACCRLSLLKINRGQSGGEDKRRVTPQMVLSRATSGLVLNFNGGKLTTPSFGWRACILGIVTLTNSDLHLFVLSTALAFSSGPLAFQLAVGSLFDGDGRPHDPHRLADGHCFRNPSCRGPRRYRGLGGGDDTLVDHTRYKGLSLVGWDVLTLSFRAGKEAQKMQRREALRFQ